MTECFVSVEREGGQGTGRMFAGQRTSVCVTAPSSPSCRSAEGKNDHRADNKNDHGTTMMMRRNAALFVAAVWSTS